MAVTYGLTPEGFVSKPMPVIDQEMDDALQDNVLGRSAGTETDGRIPLRSAAGQLRNYWADGLAAMWDLLQAVVDAFDPNKAVDSALDSLSALTGTEREPARYSEVTGTCTGTPGTVLLVGRLASVSSSGSTFATTEEATIEAVDAWATTTPYVVGDRVYTDVGVYQCATAGTSAGSGDGPAGTDFDALVTDGTAEWRYLGAGTGAVDVPFVAQDAGPVGAVAGSLDTISTPVGGWSSVVNILDAVSGAAKESNAQLRVRRQAELGAIGGSTADAIRGDLLRVNQGSTDPDHDPVTACTVFHNDTNVTDSDGLPPHSVEVLVRGAPDADVAQAVWNAVGAGIATYGNQTSTVTDSEGNSQTVKWSRPQEVQIYVTLTTYYDASQYPSTGAAALVEAYSKSAVLTYGASLPIGQSVRALPVGAAVADGPAALTEGGDPADPAPEGSSPTPGVLDVTPIYIGTAPSPGTSTPVAISRRQLAVFDSTRITVTAVAETP